MSFLQQVVVARATLFAFAAMGVLWGAYAALIPDTKAMLGAGDAAFGSLILATPIAATITMLFAPRIAPRFGQHVLPVACLALAIAFAVPGWLHVPAMFALAMVFVGSTNGFLDVTMNARVSAIEADTGLHLMNLNHAAYSFGYAGSAILTGVARDAGWPPGEILTVAAVVVALGVPLAIERGHGVNGFARSVREAGGLGMLPVWGGLIAMIAFMAENSSENWSALHIERTLGGSKHEGSFGPAVLALTMGIGRTFGQVVVAHVDEGKMMRWGAIIAALGTAIVGLAPTPAVAYGGLIIAGLGGSVLAPNVFAVVGRLSSPERRAHVIARATALGYLGYFFGPPTLGFMSEILGLAYALVAMAGVILLVLVLYPRLIATGDRSGHKT